MANDLLYFENELFEIANSSINPFNHKTASKKYETESLNWFRKKKFLDFWLFYFIIYRTDTNIAHVSG